jgi:HSP20 family protein
MTMQGLLTRAKEGLDHLKVLASPPVRDVAPAAVDIVERDTSYIVRVDVPGATRRSTDVVLADERTIVVHARRLDSSEDDVHDWTRRIVLPRPVEAEGVEAIVASGVLTIELPRRDGGRRRIAIGSHQ